MLPSETIQNLHFGPWIYKIIDNTQVIGYSFRYRSCGYRQRKITSPGLVNRGRAIDMLEVINLTNPEGAKNLTELFFEDELKMDFTADPRFNN